MGILKDLTGKTFGRLTVIEFSGLDNSRKSKWVCRCECGNEFVTVGVYLCKGDTKSCGCYKIYLNKTRDDKNDYEVEGDLTRLFVPDYKGNTLICLMDTADFPKISDKKWFAKSSMIGGSLYVQTSVKVNGVKRIYFLHRVVTNAPKGMLVDHKNHDTLDNRSQNLRVCTSSENGQNRKGNASNNKSGVRNVSWVSRDKKWKVQITLEGKSYHFGMYSDLQEAKEVAAENRKRLLPYAT